MEALIFSKENLSGSFASLLQKGFFHLLFAMCIGQGLAFTQRILLGRWLTNEDFSRYTILIETNSVLATFMTLALPIAMMRFGLKESRLRYYLNGTLTLFCFLSLIVFAFFYFIKINWGLYSDEKTESLLNFTVLFAPPFAFFNYIIAYLSADKRAKERGVLILLQRLLFFLFLLGGCWIAAWEGTLFGYGLFSAFFFIILLSRYYYPIKEKAADFPYRKVIHFSSWNSIHGIGLLSAQYLILPFSQQILEDMMAISYLGMALTFTVIAKFVFAAVNDIVFPYLMEKKNKRDFLIILIKILLLMAMLSIGILSVSFSIIPYIIELSLGDRYLGAIPLFKVLVVGEVIVGFAILFEMILVIFGKVKFMATSIIFAMIAFIMALKPFLLNFGILGAAYAFIIFTLCRTASCLIGFNLCINKFAAPKCK